MFVENVIGSIIIIAIMGGLTTSNFNWHVVFIRSLAIMMVRILFETNGQHNFECISYDKSVRGISRRFSNTHEDAVFRSRANSVNNTVDILYVYVLVVGFGG